MKVELLQDNRARVDFELQNDQKILGNTEASILYQNIVGQRYVDLHLGKVGEPKPLPAGTVIPVERTVSSFDVGIVLNGYEPLFSTIDPKAVDQIADAGIQALQGDSTAWATLVDQTGKLSETVAGRDQLLGDMITGLDQVSGPWPNTTTISRRRSPTPGRWWTPSTPDGPSWSPRWVRCRGWCASWRRSPTRSIPHCRS